MGGQPYLPESTANNEMPLTSVMKPEGVRAISDFKEPNIKNPPTTISKEEALERMLDFATPLESEEKPILSCLGQVLAEDVFSSLDLPSLDSSMRDGYAVRSQDTLGACLQRPVFLQVIGEVTAGSCFAGTVTPNGAVRIMTGAPIPRGADSVIPFEETDDNDWKLPRRVSGRVAVRLQVPTGLNIRRAGTDISRGTVVLRKGTVLGPPEIGVLASLGRARIQVIRRPVVTILSTGDELLQLGESPAYGKVFNSNAYTVAAQVLHYGGIPKVLPPAMDTHQDLEWKMLEALNADLLITTGGASKGTRDLVGHILTRLEQVSFWNLPVSGSKPITFRTIKRDSSPEPKTVSHIALPGNPFSALVAFEIFVRPFILKMLGKPSCPQVYLTAIIQDPITNRRGRHLFARVTVTREQGKYKAYVRPNQDPGALTPMIGANGLVIVPPEKEKILPGDWVQVMIPDWAQLSFPTEINETLSSLRPSHGIVTALQANKDRSTIFK